MAEERAFEVEEFAEAVKQMVISSFRPGSACCSCTCCTPVVRPGGEIAELVADEE